MKDNDSWTVIHGADITDEILAEWKYAYENRPFWKTAIDSFRKQEQESVDRNIGGFIQELRAEYKLDVPDKLDSLNFEADSCSFTFLGMTIIGISWDCSICHEKRYIASRYLAQAGEAMYSVCAGKCSERWPMWDSREFSF